MNRKRWSFFVSLGVILLLSACFLWYVSANHQLDSLPPSGDGKDRGLNIHFDTHDFSNVKSIRLRNLYNGKDTYITEETDVQALCAFLNTVKGIQGGSSKGYYEGFYSLSLYENSSAAQAVLDEEKPLFSIGFGDTGIDDIASIHYNTFEDGYPIRFLLEDFSVQQVRDTLSQYDDNSIT